jgi:hypothetical protein
MPVDFIDDPEEWEKLTGGERGSWHLTINVDEWVARLDAQARRKHEEKKREE